ncbi:MAG TPA: BlaI/MecI/CopY family transcriptional regulator [Candidatus Nitrosotalea sp.]|nr:BlaI/MecI/CopY family transcriptional regulator [Candidatus Nitrosotalea sp.]
MKKRIPPLPGGELEYAVLFALIELGGGSAREIHVRIGEPKGLVYTTTAKVLDRLVSKGLVLRRLRGRAFVYRSKMGRRELERGMAARALRDFFGRGPSPAVAALVDAVEAVDRELLDELGREVEARRRKRDGP